MNETLTKAIQFLIDIIPIIMQTKVVKIIVTIILFSLLLAALYLIHEREKRRHEIIPEEKTEDVNSNLIS